MTSRRGERLRNRQVARASKGCRVPVRPMARTGMGDHLGIKARCIGHGAMPTKVPFGPPLFPDVPIVAVDERNSLSPEGGGIHGFALLRFSGPKINVSYIDEFGGVFYSEQFTR